MSSSRNNGIYLAKGEFVSFLDANGLKPPRFLERRINLKKSTAIACAFNVILISENGDKVEENKKPLCSR